MNQKPAHLPAARTLDVLGARLAAGQYDKAAITPGFLTGEPKLEDWQGALPVFLPAHVVVEETEQMLTRPPVFDPAILRMYKKYLEELADNPTGYITRRAPNPVTGLHFSPENDMRGYALGERLSQHDVRVAVHFFAHHPEALVTVLGLHSFLDDYVQRLASRVRQNSWLWFFVPKPLGDAFMSLNSVVSRNEHLFIGSFAFHLALSHIHFAKMEGRIPGDMTESDITRFMAGAGKNVFEGRKKCPFGTLFRFIAGKVTQRKGNAPGARLWLLHQHCKAHGADEAQKLKLSLEIAAERLSEKQKPQAILARAVEYT